MKLNKKNIGEYIGYMSIAVVCVLSLVLSFGIVDLYEQPIVANAQFEAGGETYVDIPIDSYNLVYTESGSFNADVRNYTKVEFMSFVPNNQELYFLTLTYSYEHDYTLYSYLYPINSYDTVYLPGVDINCECVGGSAFVPLEIFALDYNAYPYNIVYDPLNESFWLILQDNFGSFPNDIAFTISIYEVPTNSTDNSTTESFLSLIGNGITFGFDSIASGITYTMDNLFVVDGELTNFSVIIFLMTGISLALSVLKFVLNFIFSFGGKD